MKIRLRPPMMKVEITLLEQLFKEHATVGHYLDSEDPNAYDAMAQAHCDVDSTTPHVLSATNGTVS